MYAPTNAPMQDNNPITNTHVTGFIVSLHKATMTIG